MLPNKCEKMSDEWWKLSDEKTLPKQTLRFPMFYFSGIRIPIPNNMAFFVRYSVFAKKIITEKSLPQVI